MTRVCVQCGAEFEQKPGVRPMRFCSLTCSRRFETAQRANDAEYKARKAARDRAYAATPEGRARCRAAERKYREKRRAARLAELQERLATSPIHCQRCGAPLDPQRPGRKVYCAECGREVNREKTRENMARRYEAKKAARREKAEARKAARNEKTWRSETRICLACGRSFAPGRYNQVFCSPVCYKANSSAADARRKSERRAAARPLVQCPWCGKAFTPTNGNQVYCSKECKAGANRKRDRDRYASKASGGGLTNLQIAQVQSDMSLPPAERYAASKAWTPAMSRFAQKIYEQHHGLFSCYRPTAGFNN